MTKLRGFSMRNIMLVPLAASFSGFLDIWTKAYDRFFCLDYYLLNQAT